MKNILVLVILVSSFSTLTRAEDAAAPDQATIDQGIIDTIQSGKSYSLPRLSGADGFMFRINANRFIFTSADQGIEGTDALSKGIMNAIYGTQPEEVVQEMKAQGLSKRANDTGDYVAPASAKTCGMLIDQEDGTFLVVFADRDDCRSILLKTYNKLK